MTTPTRIETNRRNVLKSTGPRTPRGKAKASLNSMRHGFRSRDALLPGENSRDFFDLLHRLCAEFSPATATQEILLDQMAVAYWKLARLQRIENYVYRVGCEKDSFVSTLREYLSSDDQPDNEPDDEPESPPPSPDELLGIAYLRDANSTRAFVSLSNYEARLERSFLRALRELTRRTQPSPQSKLTERSQPCP